MSTISVNKSNATIDVGSDASYDITGDDDTVAIGDDSIVTADGSALNVKISGAGDVVTIGGDGEWAPNGSDDLVTFETSGTLDALAASRVDVEGSNVTATLAGDDTFGIYGAGDTVFARGSNNGLWVGLNGEAAAGGNIDAVFGLTGGTLFEMGDSSVAVRGSGYTTTMSGDDLLHAIGEGVKVNGSGAGNVLMIGGGSPGDDNLVTLSDGGFVKALAQSDLQVTADHVVVRGAGIDSLELIGASDRAALNVVDGEVTVGQNGNPNAGLDVVMLAYQFLPPARVVELPNSNIRVVGDSVSVMLSGEDRVVIVGHGELVSDTVGGNRIMIGGNGETPQIDQDNLVTLNPGDSVVETANSQLGVQVNGAPANGQYAVFMSANDSLSIGAGTTVHVPLAAGDDVLGGFGPTDVLALAAHFSDVNALLAATTDDSPTSATIHFDASGDLLHIAVNKATIAIYAQEGIIKFA